ncbi:FAD-dependent oxidoreductase [Amycolatopsis sp. NBC_01480]|uniref:FAD-dependent oxidoreductase n=1 Tax=Amycolatopsis sp. NBC_01480 TaxID=2903562 RepID=UPI002E2B6F71|nr:FAD-dependent oxidoreductase [Amycolatopsis sp. NBC_01480]
MNDGVRARGRAIVAGAGIVGLSTALSLRRAGFEVAVRERAPQVRQTGAGLGIWQHTITELERLGLGPRLSEIKAELSFDRFRDPSGAVLDVGDMPPGRVVHRRRLGALLVSAVGEENIRTGREVVDYTEDEAGIVVHYAGGDQERADLLVGADGLNSRVRRRLIPGSESHYDEEGHHVWRAVLPFDGDLGDGYPTIGHHRTRGTVMRLADGSCFWVLAQFGVTGEFAGSPKQEAVARVENLHDGPARCVLREVVLATPEDSVLDNQVAVVPEIPRWKSNRVVLAGDAAHAMSPHIGSGASLGIEDAYVLGDRLGRTDIASALDSYQTDRMARYRQVRRHAKAMATAPTPASYVELFSRYLNWLNNTAA